MYPNSDISCFYYDERKRIPLKPSEKHVVIRLTKAAGTVSETEFIQLVQGSDSLIDGLILIDVERVKAVNHETLDRAGALLPVFEWTGTLLVMLPKIIFSAPDKARIQAFRYLRKKYGTSIEIARAGEDFLITTKSGRSLETMAIANDLCENVKGVSAVPSFHPISPQTP